MSSSSLVSISIREEAETSFHRVGDEEETDGKKETTLEGGLPVDGKFLGGQSSIILGYRRLSVKSLIISLGFYS